MVMVEKNQLKEAVREIVSRDDVKYVIGYSKGTYGFRVTPAFAFSPGDAETFIFSPLCANNLVVYLMLEEKLPLSKDEKEDTRKIGLVVKGCDSRAIVQIIQEKGLKREDVVLIGIPCTGIIDPEKMKAQFPHQVKTVDIEEKDDTFVVVLDGVTHQIPRDELIFEKCKHCENPNPVICDILVGQEVKITKKEDYRDIQEFEKKSLKEKWAYWEKQFEKCIRCYACRDICPMCYCKECMADQLSPQWILRSVNISENTAWNLIRAFHLAGRCVGCGECERACPVGIPLTKLNKKIEKEIKEMFDYVSGIDAEAKPLLAMFKPDDPEEFIL